MGSPRKNREPTWTPQGALRALVLAGYYRTILANGETVYRLNDEEIPLEGILRTPELAGELALQVIAGRIRRGERLFPEEAVA
ncbi:MAG: hypothetical protein ABR575_00220 [Actinomycetota bacterium]